jgi:ketosteroid isomerase-like protein
VVVRWSATVTPNAPINVPLYDVPIPAGKTITRTGVSILTLRDGKVIEERTYEDRLGVMQQLGLVPSAG